MLVGLASASLAGCLGLFPDRSPVTEAHLGSPVEEVAVSMIARDGDRFDPTLVHVTPGATVHWTLASGVHDTVAYHQVNDLPLRMPEEASPWDSGLMSAVGETYSVPFEQAGVYDYLCTPHEHVGMVGRVVVGEPDLVDEPAMYADASPLPREAQRVLGELNQRVHDVIG